MRRAADTRFEPTAAPRILAASVCADAVNTQGLHRPATHASPFKRSLTGALFSCLNAARLSRTAHGAAPLGR